MGRSDPYIFNFYNKNVCPKGEVALLGFSSNTISTSDGGSFSVEGDLYDLKLNNWDINQEWSLPKKYDTIICTRCAYFAKDPEGFIKRCHQHLNDGGTLCADWGLGDHWRFKDYKVGWVKNNEHEYATNEPDNHIECEFTTTIDDLSEAELALGDEWTNANSLSSLPPKRELEKHYLWSAVWDDDLLKDPQVKNFQQNILKFNYEDLKKAVFEEIPQIIELGYIKKYFNVEYSTLSLWEDKPQLYIFIRGKKK